MVKLGDRIPEDFLRAIFDAAARLNAVGTSSQDLGREVALAIGRRRPEILAWFNERGRNGSDPRVALDQEGHVHGWWRLAHQWSGHAGGHDRTEAEAEA